MVKIVFGKGAKTIEVDAITSAWKHGEGFLTSETKKRMLNESMFEVGAELATTVIPGAAAGLTLGKHLKRHRGTRRTSSA